MTLCFALLPTALDTLSKEKAWQTFIIDLLLHCQSKYVLTGTGRFCDDSHRDVSAQFVN